MEARQGKCPECGTRFRCPAKGPAECGHCGWNEYLEKELEDAARDFEAYLDSLSDEELEALDKETRSE